MEMINFIWTHLQHERCRPQFIPASS